MPRLRKEMPDAEKHLAIEIKQNLSAGKRTRIVESKDILGGFKSGCPISGQTLFKRVRWIQSSGRVLSYEV